MTNFFNILDNILFIRVLGIELKFIIIVYPVLCWAGTFAYGLKRTKRIKWFPSKHNWLFIVFSPFLLPLIFFYSAVTIVYLGTFKAVLNLYKNIISALLFVIIQFWKIIPNTPVHMNSIMLNKARIHWSHDSQIFILAIFLILFSVKFFWRLFFSKRILKKYKFLHLIIVIAFIISGIALFDMVLSQTFIDWKTPILIFLTIIAGGLIDKLIKREKLTFNFFDYL